MNEELLKVIINKHGKNKQVMQTVEEISELIVELTKSNEKLQNPQITKAINVMAKLVKSLNKNINRGKNNIEDIILEIADVQIMLGQLTIIYDIDSEKLLGAVEYKMQRMKERLANGDDT